MSSKQNITINCLKSVSILLHQGTDSRWFCQTSCFIAADNILKHRSFYFPSKPKKAHASLYWCLNKNFYQHNYEAIISKCSLLTKWAKMMAYLFCWGFKDNLQDLIIVCSNSCTELLHVGSSRYVSMKSKCRRSSFSSTPGQNVKVIVCAVTALFVLLQVRSTVSVKLLLVHCFSNFYRKSFPIP